MHPIFKTFYVFDDRVYTDPESSNHIATIVATDLIEALELALGRQFHGLVLASEMQFTEFDGDVAGLFPIYRITMEIMRLELANAQKRESIEYGIT